MDGEGAPHDLPERADDPDGGGGHAGGLEPGQCVTEGVAFGRDPVPAGVRPAHVVPDVVAVERCPRGGPVDHQPVVGDAVAYVEEGPVAAAVDPQRRAHPHPAGTVRRRRPQPGAVRRGLVGQALHGGAAGRPFRRHAVQAAQRLLAAPGHRDHRLDLERVTDRHRAPGPPDRPGGLLRRGLPRLVDEQPSQGLPAETGEQPVDGRERAGDHRHHQEKRLPGRSRGGGPRPGPASGQDVHQRMEVPPHRGRRGGQERLVQAERGQEQCGAGRSELLIRPGRRLLAFVQPVHPVHPVHPVQAVRRRVTGTGRHVVSPPCGGPAGLVPPGPRLLAEPGQLGPVPL